MFVNVCYGISNDCVNFYESYGEICVHCGCCASKNPDARNRYKKQLILYKRMLDRELNFDNWYEPFIETQKKNVKRNIIYFKRAIRRKKKVLKTLR